MHAMSRLRSLGVTSPCPSVCLIHWFLVPSRTAAPRHDTFVPPPSATIWFQTKQPSSWLPRERGIQKASCSFCTFRFLFLHPVFTTAVSTCFRLLSHAFRVIPFHRTYVRVIIDQFLLNLPSGCSCLSTRVASALH